MIYATKAQIQKIHVLLKQLGMIESKAEIMYQFSDGRTESTRGLSIDEAKRLIKNLAEFDPSERMKSLIFSLAYQADIIYGSTADDKRINVAKLNMFLKERGTVKKELNAMSYEELLKTQRQFEGIVRNQAKRKQNKEAGTAIKHLLAEINLQVK